MRCNTGALSVELVLNPQLWRVYARSMLLLDIAIMRDLFAQQNHLVVCAHIRIYVEQCLDLERVRKIGEVSFRMFSWLGHVARTSEGRLPLKVLFCQFLV